jgi:signal transduction histidine kinase
VLGAVADAPMWASHPLLPAVNLPITAAYAATGMLLWDEPRQRGTALALILAGISRPFGWLNEWEVGPLPCYAVVFGYLDNIFGVWALLRYPGERLDRRSRRFVTVTAVWLIAGPLFLTFVSRPVWLGDSFRRTKWWPGVWPDRHLYESATLVFDLGAMGLATVFLVMLIARAFGGSRRHRSIILPMIFAGALAGIAAGVVMLVAAVSGPNDELFSIEGMAELAVPVAFLVSIVQQRLSKVTNLVTGLNQSMPTAEFLRQVLRSNLDDPELDLAVWSPDHQRYLTVSGSPAVPEPGRVAHEVTSTDGPRLALLLIQPSTARDAGLLTTAATMCRLVLENVLLSRRLMTAHYDARQRIAADLHDGAQKDLCAVKVALSAAARGANPATLSHITQARTCVDGAVEELHHLAHGIYPHTLSRFGLQKAVEETIDQLDLPASISAPTGRLPSAVEKTIYFVTCEALTNTWKHADADTVTVNVEQSEGQVTVTITDDGSGGAVPEAPGLRRLRDRVRAFGGELTVDSPQGAGTRLTARIPCV